MWNRLGFRDRLLLVGFSLLVLMLVALGGGASTLVDRHLRGELQARAQQMIPLFNAALGAPMAQRDYASVTSIIEEIRGSRDLVYVEVVDPSGRPVTGPRPMFSAHAVPIVDNPDTLSFSAPLTLSGQPLGRVNFGLSRRTIDETRNAILTGIGFLSAAALAVFSVALALFSVAVTRPLKSLITAARDIQAGNYEVELESRRHDEFGVLMRAFAKMTLEVSRKVSELVYSENLQRRYLQESLRRQQEATTALQQAQLAHRAKSDFIANMSHEIRTPMNSILGYAELLERTPLAVQQRAFVGRLKESSTTLLGLINDILDFSKIEAGQLKNTREAFDLTDLIDTVCGLFIPSLRDKGLQLHRDLPPEVPTQLVGDRLRVQQVLANLVGNAVKFTSQGQIDLEVRITQEAPAPGQEPGAADAPVQLLRIAVRDTGIGIAPDQLAAVFQPFSQADGSITRRFGGTGLGLSISRSLAELMGGRLEVRSELGVGSEFALLIPLEVRPQAAALPSDESEREQHQVPAALPAASPQDVQHALPEGDLQGVAELLRELDQALAGKMMKARQLAQDVSERLNGTRWEPTLAEVRDNAQRLRFPQAREQLSGLMKRLESLDAESAP